MSGGGAEVMRSEAEEQVLGNLVGKRVIGSFSHQRRIPGFHEVNGLRKAREERGREGPWEAVSVVQDTEERSHVDESSGARENWSGSWFSLEVKRKGFPFSLSVGQEGKRKIKVMFWAPNTFVDVGKTTEGGWWVGACMGFSVQVVLLLRCLSEVQMQADLAAG